MKVPIYQIDAFASGLFRGNPAAICPLDRWLPDPVLQAIAAENNLAETAFYIRKDGQYHLRWFTPTIEVDLCGHATVAAAAVILGIRQEIADSRIAFMTRSGALWVDRSQQNGESLYTLDFPSRPAAEHTSDPELATVLGCDAGALRDVHLSREKYLLCVFETQAQVLALQPQMERLGQMPYFAVIATAPGDDCDFVSRCFAPAAGIPEDPVTGSAHCTLIPYWSARLGKKEMFAKQVSARGGELWCANRGERVGIGGHAVKFLEGHIELPDSLAV